MFRSQNFKKDVGFIKSQSEKRLMKNPKHQVSDSDEFSSFEYVKESDRRGGSDEEFSPYKQPQTNHSSTNYRQVQGNRKLNSKPTSNKNSEKMKYPPKSNYKNLQNQLLNGKPEDKKLKVKQRNGRSPDLERRLQMVLNEDNPVTFSNEKLRMNYKPSNPGPKSQMIKSDTFTLDQVNQICEKINKIQTSYAFGGDGNLRRVEKSNSRRKPKYEQSEDSSECQSPGKASYKDFVEERKTQPERFYEEEFSLGDPNSASRKRATEPIADAGFTNSQHRLLMKPKRQSLDDESPISQEEKQDLRETTFNKGTQQSQKNKPVGTISGNAFQNRSRRQQYSEEDEQSELITEYKITDFSAKNKGIKQQIRHMHKNSRQKDSQNNKKMRTQQGLTVAKGGVCFELDTKDFNPPKAEQNQNVNSENYDESEYLQTKKRDLHRKFAPAHNKKKKVDPKYQALKRRQQARNYDQMARRNLFNIY